jgi:hypothetical protein
MEDETSGRRRSARPALASVAATVVAVLAVLTIPHLFSAQGTGGPSVPDPTPSHAPEPPGTRSWQPVKCATRGDDGCAVPTRIDHAGLLLSSVGGQRFTWRAEPGAIADLALRLPRSKAERWVLVGGRFTGPDSRVTVEIGVAEPVVVPPDRLSLFAVGHGRPTIRVTDTGTARVGEVLRIEAYAQR